MEKTITKRENTKAVTSSVKRVAAYARVSTGKDQMLHSLAAQVSYYSNYIKNHPGWIYKGVYTDEAMTGTKENRPEFRHLIQDCRDEKIDLVITKSISRFARNTVDLLNTVREMKDLGVDVYFEEQNLHTMSGDGELMLSILASYAQEESRSTSENCKWRIRRQFENGELANLRFMFGYKIVKGKVQIDPGQAAVVRLIFEDYINGLSTIKIAEKVKAMDIPALRKGCWNSGRILAIIKNEKYTGDSLLQKKFVVDHLSKRLIWNNGDLPKYFAEDTHPPIIDKETFQKAQAILNQRRAQCRTKSDNRNRYPFSGVIRCGWCGWKYKRKVRDGKPVWQCTKFLQEGKAACQTKQIPEYVLYKASMEVLDLKEFDSETFEKEIEEILVPKEQLLIFVFRDGHTVEKNWQYKARCDSWTDEKRDIARNHAMKRWSTWHQK